MLLSIYRQSLVLIEEIRPFWPLPILNILNLLALLLSVPFVKCHLLGTLPSLLCLFSVKVYLSMAVVYSFADHVFIWSSLFR